MEDHKKYRVIVSDRAKLMLGTHMSFLKQINREAAVSKKKQIMKALRSLSEMPTRYPFFNEEPMKTDSGKIEDQRYPTFGDKTDYFNYVFLRTWV